MQLLSPFQPTRDDPWDADKAAHLARRAGFGATPDELRELDALDPAQLADRALRFHRRALDRRVQELGLPPGVDAEGYAALKELPHHEFFRSWRRLDPTEAYGRPEPDVARSDGSGPQPGPNQDARRRAMLLDRARRLLAPTFEERVELAGTDVETRSIALRKRARERCLAFLEEHALLEPEQLAELRAVEGPAFEALAHRALRAEMDRCVGKRSMLRDRFRERWDGRREGRGERGFDPERGRGEREPGARFGGKRDAESGSDDPPRRR